MSRSAARVSMVLFALAWCGTGQAETVTFFDASQGISSVSSGVTTDTVESNGYQFTYSRDKLFTGGVGLTTPIGRAVRVSWPSGLEAQAVTTPPDGGQASGAQIVVERVDGDVFDLTALTFELLGNTAATGASLEIMPTLNGEDAFNDPLALDASGYYGSTFSYDTATNILGSTASLTGYQQYKIGLFVDFALMNLTVAGAAVPEPSTGGLVVCAAAVLTVGALRSNRRCRVITLIAAAPIQVVLNLHTPADPGQNRYKSPRRACGAVSPYRHF